MHDIKVKIFSIPPLSRNTNPTENYFHSVFLALEKQAFISFKKF